MSAHIDILVQISGSACQSATQLTDHGFIAGWLVGWLQSVTGYRKSVQFCSVKQNKHTLWWQVWQTARTYNHVKPTHSTPIAYKSIYTGIISRRVSHASLHSGTCDLPMSAWRSCKRNCHRLNSYHTFIARYGIFTGLRNHIVQLIWSLDTRELPQLLQRDPLQPVWPVGYVHSTS